MLLEQIVNLALIGLLLVLGYHGIRKYVEHKERIRVCMVTQEAFSVEETLPVYEPGFRVRLEISFRSEYDNPLNGMVLMGTVERAEESKVWLKLDEGTAKRAGFPRLVNASPVHEPPVIIAKGIFCACVVSNRDDVNVKERPREGEIPFEAYVLLVNS